MPKQTIAVTASVVLLAAAMLALAADPAQPKMAETDPFVGWYTWGSLRGMDNSAHIQITREGDAYRMSQSAGKDYLFKKRKEGVLEDEEAVLGTLTLGQLSFADAPDDRIVVVKASFCYEQFLLFKRVDKPKVTDTTASESPEEGT